MSPAPRILPLPDLPDGLGELCAGAAGEGFGFLDRLVAEWRSGANRFAGPGEVLLGAFRAGDLIGVGGLNRDPYADREGVGRLRHLYVARPARGSGVGAALVRGLLGHAGGVFHLVRLRTGTREAGDFYVRLGFHPVRDEGATHAMALRPPRVRPGAGPAGRDGPC